MPTHHRYLPEIECTHSVEISEIWMVGERVRARMVEDTNLLIKSECWGQSEILLLLGSLEYAKGFALKSKQELHICRKLCL